MAPSSRYRRPIVSVYFGNVIIKTKGMMELSKANKKARTTLYFFSTKDVDFKRRRIRGMQYRFHKKRWVSKDFPMPDVLYMRGGSSGRVRRTVARFDKMGIPRINPLVRFNKGELFRDLKKDPDIRPFLPFTKAINRLSEARKYVRELGRVYIKACYGRKGTKVMRVVKQPGKDYAYSYSVINHLVKKKVRHFKDLKSKMKSFFGDREVIVQKAIDLVQVDHNQSVDFRAELQRNGTGELTIAGISARIGQKDSPITTHGGAYKMSDYLTKMFPHYSDKDLDDLKERMKDFVLKVYTSVEKCYGKFGELGIDFAVDKNGNILLIECNAQSAKVSFGKAQSSRKVRKIYLNPLEYAKWIAKGKK